MISRIIFLLNEKWQRDSLPDAREAVQTYRDYGLEADLLVTGRGEDLPAPGYSTLFIADSDLALQQLACSGGAYCAYSHAGNRSEKLSAADYILMEPQWVDRDSLVKIWQRQRSLPWTILETERCIVREFVPEDLDAIYALYDAEAVQYLEPPSGDRRREREILAGYIDRVYRLCGYGHWAVLSKETGELIGRMGFALPSSSVPGPVPDARFGYLLRRDWRGRGVAGEVCGAILQYGFEQLGFASVGADAAVSNVRSVKILDAFGFLAVAEKDDQRYYILNKEDWRKLS